MGTALIFKKISEILSFCIFIGGSIVLIGWIFDISIFKSILPNYVAMKANTAICFMLIGISLWLLQTKWQGNKTAFRVACLCAFVVFMIGFLTFMEYIFGWDFGIDQLLFKESATAILTSSTGRMAFNTSIIFVILSIVLLLHVFEVAFFFYVAHSLVILAGIFSLLSFTGYFYGANPLYLSIKFSTAMAVHASILFIMSCIGCLFIRPEQGIMKTISSDNYGSLVLRRILPIVIVIPLVLGFLKCHGEKAGLFSNEFGVSLVAVCNIVSISLFVYILSIYLNRFDAKRKQVEGKLQYSNDFSQTILDSMKEVIAVINIDDYTIEKVNKTFIEMYQLNEDDLKGKTCYKITHAISIPCDSTQDPCPLIETVKTGCYAKSEHTHYSSDGQEIFVEVSTSPIRDETGKITKVLHITRDITKRKQKEKEISEMQTQLRQTQKMEAIGTLAGGIAHDFNNILGSIIGYADLVKDDISEGTRAYQNQEEVLIAAKRAKELVKQILTFSRKGEAKLVPVKINSIVAESLKMLRSSLPTTIEISHDINCTNSIMADETHIHQVLLNLGTNALHAMQENGGILQISLSDVNIDLDTMTSDGKLQHGSYVKLTVKDTGSGMSKEVKERIFEPFYTTKAVGKGTGLGLSVVNGIVENHNGIITVDSKLGEGTTFEIFFPCVEDIKIKESENLEMVFGHGERILFVDDEKGLVNMATLMLTRMGYGVVGKTDSVEALSVFREDPNKFDFVITDQTMPKMKGTELAKEILNIRPEIPIVLCSGYSESIDPEKVKAIGIKVLVMKPVNRIEISQIIREILDKKGATV